MPIHAAAVLYNNAAELAYLLRFAETMKKRGWKIGGLRQQVLRDGDGLRTGVDAIDLDNGERFPIVRTDNKPAGPRECGLDLSALTLSSSALQRAIDEKADLVIVEKFGEAEQRGEGIADSILSVMAEGIPILIAVPAFAADQWNRFTGGLTSILPMDLQAFRDWWPKDRLYRELTDTVPDIPVTAVTVGLNWTLVETEKGAGLAHTPARGTHGCRSVPEAGHLTRYSLRTLAEKCFSDNPFEVAIGIAAINCHINRADLEGADLNGLDVFGPQDGPVTFIGAFKGAREKFPAARIVELDPKPGQFPASAAPDLIRSSDAVFITASTLINKTLPPLLAAGQNGMTALVGPGTPLSPILHEYGLHALCGLVVRDTAQVRRIVAAGGSVRDLKPYCRHVSLVNDA
nr:DUF2478 domain-containing protein [Sneathiella chinensis]